MAQRLVVTTGYACTGKTTAANFLASLGFVRVSSDDIRRELFGITDYREYEPEGQAENETVVWAKVRAQKQAALLAGNDVVVDTAAVTAERRQSLLSLPPGIGEVDRVLLYCTAHAHVLAHRWQERYHGADVYADWADWEDPVEPGGVTMVQYRNDVDADFDAMRDDLQRRFS